MYELKKSDRSGWNESKALDVYGCIVHRDSDTIICYVTSKRQADFILDNLNMRRKEK